MLAKDVAAAEEQAHGFYEDDVEERTEGDLTIFAFREGFSNDYFYAEETEKTGIVLHFTAGFLQGDIPTLTQAGNHVSVPYVVARNGRIYELFPPKYWSYHLGQTTVGGNKHCSSRTIGIELSNVGPLYLKDQTLRYRTNTGFSAYCDLTETDFYTKPDEPFREADYFATFTAQQYASVNKLVTSLADSFGLPRTFIDGADRFRTFASSDVARAYRGVASHVNYRPSGKWDIGPSFDWALVEAT